MEKLTQSYHLVQQYNLPASIDHQGKLSLHPPSSHGFSFMAGSGSQKDEADFDKAAIKNFFQSSSFSTFRTRTPSVLRQERERTGYSQWNGDKVADGECHCKDREEHEQVIGMHVDGYSYDNIVEKSGCSMATVGRILKKHGYSAHKRTTEQQQQKIAELYSSKDGLDENRIKLIADSLRLDAPTVRRVLRDQGLLR